jgi:putative membrane protein insertion efficiency factor
MGHRDSSATLGRASAVRSTGCGIGAPAAEHRPQDAAGGAPAGEVSRTARGLILCVRIYQSFFSALMPSACKFYPSCSQYAAEALRLHGAKRGFWLALRRVSRCHPFTRGGVDLVPEANAVTCDHSAAGPAAIHGNSRIGAGS